jgi:hypothetical protein
LLLGQGGVRAGAIRPAAVGTSSLERRAFPDRNVVRLIDRGRVANGGGQQIRLHDVVHETKITRRMLAVAIDLDAFAAAAGPRSTWGSRRHKPRSGPGAVRRRLKYRSPMLSKSVCLGIGVGVNFVDALARRVRRERQSRSGPRPAGKPGMIAVDGAAGCIDKALAPAPAGAASSRLRKAGDVGRVAGQRHLPGSGGTEPKCRLVQARRSTPSHTPADTRAASAMLASIKRNRRFSHCAAGHQRLDLASRLLAVCPWQSYRGRRRAGPA